MYAGGGKGCTGGTGGGAGSMPRFSRLNRPNTISSTGQVLSKLYGVKLFSANSTPTVISVIGPRIARSSDGSRSRRILRRVSLSTWSRMSLEIDAP